MDRSSSMDRTAGVPSRPLTEVMPVIPFHLRQAPSGPAVHAAGRAAPPPGTERAVVAEHVPIAPARLAERKPDLLSEGQREAERFAKLTSAEIEAAARAAAAAKLEARRSAAPVDPTRAVPPWLKDAPQPQAVGRAPHSGAAPLSAPFNLITGDYVPSEHGARAAAADAEAAARAVDKARIVGQRTTPHGYDLVTNTPLPELAPVFGLPHIERSTTRKR